MNTLTDTQIAWLAGLFEGEGCICLRPGGTRLTIEMTDEDIINRVAELTGLGSVIRLEKRKQKGGKPNHKDSWKWYIGYREDVKNVLVAIYPYLGIRRRIAADKALSVISQMRPRRRNNPEEGEFILCPNCGIEGFKGSHHNICKECVSKKAMERYWIKKGLEQKL